MKHRLLQLVVACFLIVSLGGCSFLLVRSPPPRPLWDRVGWARCTQHQTWPIVDTVVAVSAALAVVLPFTGPDVDNSTSTVELTTSALQMAGWALSAYYGFKTTGQCQAFWMHRLRQRGNEAPAPRQAPPVGEGRYQQQPPANAPQAGSSSRVLEPPAPPSTQPQGAPQRN